MCFLLHSSPTTFFTMYKKMLDLLAAFLQDCGVIKPKDDLGNSYTNL